MTIITPARTNVTGPILGETVLTAVRTNDGIVGSKIRLEHEVFMLSLYDKQRGRLYNRGTPSVILKTIEERIKKNDFTADTKVHFYYRHGPKPESTMITVRELRTWLNKIIDDFTTARKVLVASPSDMADKKDPDTPPLDMVSRVLAAPGWD